MDFFGVGTLEVLAIAIIILLVAGPKDLQRIGRELGRGLNKLYRSPTYNAIRRASQELRNLPQQLAREANLDEQKELEALRQTAADLRDAANTIGGAVTAAERDAARATHPRAIPPPATPAPSLQPPAEPSSAAQPFRAWVEELPPQPPPAPATGRSPEEPADSPASKPSAAP